MRERPSVGIERHERGARISLLAKLRERLGDHARLGGLRPLCVRPFGARRRRRGHSVGSHAHAVVAKLLVLPDLVRSGRQDGCQSRLWRALRRLLGVRGHRPAEQPRRSRRRLDRRRRRRPSRRPQVPAPQDAGAVGRRGAHQDQREDDGHPRDNRTPPKIEYSEATSSLLQDLSPDSGDRLRAQRLNLPRGIRQGGGARFQRVGIDVAIAPPHRIVRATSLHLFFSVEASSSASSSRVSVARSSQAVMRLRKDARAR